MESQCLGLATALGAEPSVKRIALRTPWRLLSPFLQWDLRHAFRDSPLVPPWPELLIATGRQSVPASLYLRQTAPRTRRVQIQDPGIDPKNFDLVIAPAHDSLKGPNIIETIGALHGVTPAKLRAAADHLAANLVPLPRPYIGVLIGGANKAYRFGVPEVSDLAAALVSAAREMHGSLLVTPSRRTGADNLTILKNTIGRVPNFVWDGEGSNPYFGILGIADVLLVTSDSVNMVTEACASGKPVYVYHLPGGTRKFTRFHDVLQSHHHARPFQGSLEPWPAVTLDEMPVVAATVRRMLTR
jgi:hypothetical protein